MLRTGSRASRWWTTRTAMASSMSSRSTSIRLQTIKQFITGRNTEVSMSHELHDRFAKSVWGETLEQNIRFGDFKPSYIDNDLWEYLLGDDVNNLRHMPYTAELAKQLARYERIGGSLLELTAITHDWGEAIVGDVALPDKIADGQDERELSAYWQIANHIAPDYDLSQVPEVVWGEHELSEPFNAVEYMGYCQTGIRAGKMALLLSGNVLHLG